MALGVAENIVGGQSFPVRENISITSDGSRSKFFNYGAKMLRLRNCGFFAIALIFAACHFEVGSSDVIVLGSQKQKASRFVDRAYNNVTEGLYSLEYNDSMHFPIFKKHESAHFEYHSFVPGFNIEVENGISQSLVINKCCSSSQYFDAKNFVCVPSKRQNSTKSDFLFENIKSDENDSNFLFTENFSGCENQSVLAVRLASRVTIGTRGISIDGEGAFTKYCVDRSFENSLQTVVLTCQDPIKFCTARTCFRKCCPLSYSYVASGRKCQKSTESFRPKFYNLSTLARVDYPTPWELGIYLGDACGAKGKFLLERDAGEMSYLGIDGTLLVPVIEKQRAFSDREFCVETVKVGNVSEVESFLCFSKTGARFENSPLQFFLLSLGFIISCMFLFVTFLVYFFSTKSQNLYGKTLMCYIACLFTAYLCLAVIELKSKEIDKTVCTSMGYSLLFSFLAAFFWLNVMSFDIWKTFRVDRSVDRSKPDKRKLQFVWYSLYAWSFPSAITAACAYVNHIQDFPYEAIKPDIGEENCWFSKKRKGIYVFFIIPISLVITCNVIFYVQTAWKIWKVKSDVKKMNRQKTKKFSANKEQFLINGKLFIVMGVTWSLEIISFFVPHPIWYITDAANALHGVFIFAVFVLKKKVFHQVSEQMRAPLKKMRQLTTSDSEEISRRKNVVDLNSESKTCATGAFTYNYDSRK